MRMLLEFRNLTVYRDETRVLDRFSLTIPARQNVAILGPNGSGKSTLIKLVTRELYPVVAPDAEIRVLGRDRWVLSELREHLGHRVERSDGDLHARHHRARARVVGVLRQRGAVAAPRGARRTRSAGRGRARDDGGGAPGRSRR